jgi:predicted PurR-regulated permease PerM
MGACATTLRRWLSGQLLVMACTGTIVTLALKLIGIDFWLLFGLLAAALDFIPYVGPILAFGTIAIVTLGAQPDKIGWVLALFFVVQQIEGQVLMPTVMRERVKLPEVHLLVLMLLLSSFLGIAGALLAPPMLAVGRTVYLMTWVGRMNRRRVPSPDVSLPPDSSPV